MNINQYLETLPVKDTSQLEMDQLFYANRRLYQVVDVGQKGAYKARQWRRDESTDVALSPDSPFAKMLPLIEQGQPLPEYDSRNQLLQEGSAALYVFPIEQNALEAAYLDVALCGTKGSIYVRRHERQPAFEATNGAMTFRKYYFMRTNEGVKTLLADLKHQLPGTLYAHSEGPVYWQLLHSWDSGPYDVEQTLIIPSVTSQATMEHAQIAGMDETVPHMPAIKPDELERLVEEELSSYEDEKQEG